MADVVNEAKDSKPQAAKPEGLINQLIPLEPGGTASPSRSDVTINTVKDLPGNVLNPDGTLDMPSIETKGWDPGDKNKEDLSQTQKDLLKAAKENLGRPMWNFGPNAGATMEGRLGGATSVAHIADLAGIHNLDSASVQGVAKELMTEQGYHAKPLSMGKPGDFMVDFERHRIGIIGEKGTMYHMGHFNGQEAIWKQMPLTRSPSAIAFSKDN